MIFRHLAHQSDTKEMQIKLKLQHHKQGTAVCSTAYSTTNLSLPSLFKNADLP